MRGFPFTTWIPAQTSYTQQQSLEREPANPCGTEQSTGRRHTGIINYSLSKPGPAEPLLPVPLHFISFPLNPAEQCCYVHKDKGKASCKTRSLCITGEPTCPDHTRCFGLQRTQGNLPGSSVTPRPPSIHPSIHHGEHKSHMQHTVPTSLLVANVQNQATAASYNCFVVWETKEREHEVVQTSQKTSSSHSYYNLKFALHFL